MSTPTRIDINFRYYFLLLLYSFIILLSRITIASSGSGGVNPRILNNELSFRIRKRKNEFLDSDYVRKNTTAKYIAIDPEEKQHGIQSNFILSFLTGQISFAKKTVTHLADTRLFRLVGPPIYLRLHSLTI